MGYSTHYLGAFRIDPPLNPEETAWLRSFRRSHRPLFTDPHEVPMNPGVVPTDHPLVTLWAAVLPSLVQSGAGRPRAIGSRPSTVDSCCGTGGCSCSPQPTTTSTRWSSRSRRGPTACSGRGSLRRVRDERDHAGRRAADPARPGRPQGHPAARARRERRRAGRDPPASALAQAVRDTARQARLARLLRQPLTEVVPLDRVEATRIGRLLAHRRTRDIADAHVVVCARRSGTAVVTTDPDDLRALDPDLRLHAR
ncbi:PIN domain-containing protein [Ornithinimicrobium avium]|uniref:PIN domain-containing protein n=1 Tax=Ornithinimicrobium avium TaxID=2283195 RepID=A0A345NLY7_9MICO|nr:PIN domain-containing protein [Ornithinimicrobium avium]